MKKPPSLSENSTLAIVSPSWGGPSVFPHIYQLGLNNLKALGFNIREYPSATMDANTLFHNPKQRAQDINDAFSDNEIDGIIASIGGSDSSRIIKYLDLEAISQNPKLFMGYSDTSALTSTLNQAGIVTFNGPSVMAGFAQLHNSEDGYQAYIRDFFFNNPPSRLLPTFKHVSHGYPAWADIKNTGKLNPLIESRGPQTLQGFEPVAGQLFGGCIEVLEMLKGTEYWPKPDFWYGKVFFLETSQEKPSIDYVRYWLRNYGIMGVFEKLHALLIGRPRDYNIDEQLELEAAILNVVREEFLNDRLTIVANLDFGHTDPQIILPLGIQCEVNAQTGQLKLLEQVFSQS